jgi:hypothetical protein
VQSIESGKSLANMSKEHKDWLGLATWYWPIFVAPFASTCGILRCLSLLPIF